ncbi:MAG: competence/damage-inducible protein A, partial [Acidimicrobiales bacterium]|nr:competence/damage-inducible protein A [Acidimicrobiales bacterium]
MICEVVAVGTELLLGQIVDTNSSWIGEQLAEVGIDSYFQTKVGDNPERIESVLRTALDRSDAVVVCGGLGPTQDDLTREAIATVMGVELEIDPAIVEKITTMFGSRSREMPENNLRQARVPVGARAMEQQPGTAPGLVCPVGDKVIYAVPGVPWEMKQMVLGTVIPDLRARAGDLSVIRSRVLRTWGMSESGLAELLGPEIERLDREGGPTLAFLASGIEGLKVRITAKAATEAEVDAQLADEEARVRAVIDSIVFGADDDTMEAVVLRELERQGLTLGVAESLTGGLISSRLVDVPGSSKAFRGGIVGYATQVKVDVLGVPDGSSVTDEMVRAMATETCRVLKADCSVAVTGVAGPEPWDGVDPGTVFLATSVDGVVESVRLLFPFDRPRIRQFSCITVLDHLRR